MGASIASRRMASSRSLRIRSNCASPCVERIRLVSVQHVAHGEAESAEIVLHAEQLQRVFAVSVYGLVLQLTQPRDLAERVETERGHDREHDREARDQPGGRTLESLAQQCLIIAAGAEPMQTITARKSLLNRA